MRIDSIRLLAAFRSSIAGIKCNSPSCSPSAATGHAYCETVSFFTSLVQKAWLLVFTRVSKVPLELLQSACNHVHRVVARPESCGTCTKELCGACCRLAAEVWVVVCAGGERGASVQTEGAPASRSAPIQCIVARASRWNGLVHV